MRISMLATKICPKSRSKRQRLRSGAQAWTPCRTSLSSNMLNVSNSTSASLSDATHARENLQRGSSFVPFIKACRGSGRGGFQAALPPAVANRLRLIALTAATE